MYVPTVPPYFEKKILLFSKPILEMSYIAQFELHYHALELNYEE